MASTPQIKSRNHFSKLWWGFDVTLVCCRFYNAPEKVDVRYPAINPPPKVRFFVIRRFIHPRKDDYPLSGDLSTPEKWLSVIRIRRPGPPMIVFHGRRPKINQVKIKSSQVKRFWLFGTREQLRGFWILRQLSELSSIPQPRIVLETTHDPCYTSQPKTPLPTTDRGTTKKIGLRFLVK